MQTEFYIEGIKDIEYLTLNFCVNSEGKTSEVRVVNDKTTIQDSIIISQIIDYRKAIEYNPDTKLKNNCYDQVFSFINKEFENSSINEKDFYKLEKFKIGTFKYHDINYKNTVITRTERNQVEDSDGTFDKYIIEWTKPNEYVLTYIEAAKKEHEYLIGEKINVEIIKYIDSETYLYRSNLLDRTIITGIMKKVN